MSSKRFGEGAEPPHNPEETLKVSERLFPSQDLRLAFQKLSIKTSPEAVDELLEDKKNLLVEVLQTGRLPGGILKTHDTIYISSGIDVEYPLCLGARKITLVDPSLSEESMRVALIEKIKFFDQTVQVETLDENDPFQLRFVFDFGEGKENVVISLEPKIYRKEQASHHKKGDDYHLPIGIGMVLGYRTQDAMISDEAIKDNLVAGGAILVDSDTMAFSEYVEARAEMPDYYKKTDDELRKEIYRLRGYEYVPLQTNRKRGWGKSFLIKT